jgi:thioredoxin-like negative regulator of GroEL
MTLCAQSRRRGRRFLWVALVACALGAPAPAAGRSVQDATYARIEALVRAGELDAAATALADADLPPGPRARLQGLLAMGRGDDDAAARAFRAALDERPDDAALRLYLARSELSRERPAAALAALHGTASLSRTVVAQPLLLARAQRGTGDAGAA